MYLTQVHLRNIACFHDIRLDFNPPSKNKPCPWTVLLGENGTGKSTILQMIAMSLLGRDMVREIARGVNWTSFSNGIKGRVELQLLTTSKDKKSKHAQGGNQFRTAFELGRTVKTGIDWPDDFATSDYKHLQETLYDGTNVEGGWFACGYGPWRALAHLRGYSTQTPEISKEKFYRFATMFNSDDRLTDVSNWLVNLDYQILKAQQDGKTTDVAAKQTFDRAINAFERILPNIKFQEITKDGEVIFTDGGNEVPIHKLSDGYRSTTAWIGDLVRRLVDAFPKMANPLDAQGIVLMDEIDIHLHPRWQRTIVEDVRSLFPNLQFIVSTHSPFVAQDMRPGDKIIVLQKQNGTVKFQENVESVRGWRVDQILTSYLFNLETTRDISIAIDSKEYEQLLDLQAQRRLTNDQLKRLDELKRKLDKNLSLPGETKEENQVFDAARMLLDLLDQQLADSKR